MVALNGVELSHSINIRPWPGEMLVMQPRSFSEMPDVVKALKENKCVVLNLTLMETEQAQRSVDFISGATYMMDGYQHRVGESVFLFTPSCVQIIS